MRVYIGADHAGFELKKKLLDYLNSKGIDAFECQSLTYDQYDDYIDASLDVVKKVLGEENSRGILICGTGIGMSIASNRHKGIRAAVCDNEFQAKMARSHNDANIMCLGARVIDEEQAKRLCDVFFETKFSNMDTHIRRNKRVDEI